MPTTRTWIGDDDNQASDPNNLVGPDGHPGAPQRGDTLIFNRGTINISGNDLKGDTRIVGAQDISNTVNLNNAHLNLRGRSEAERDLRARLSRHGPEQHS